MKFKWLIWMLVALIAALPVIAAPPLHRTTPSASTAVSTDKYVNANKILMYVTNQGNFAYDAAKEFGQNDGLYYPYTTVANILNGTDFDHHVIFDAGIWMGAVDSVTGDTLVTVAEYSAEYGPGQFGQDPLAGKYRVYKLYRDSMASNPNYDYSHWPEDQGAPVNPDHTPKLTGDQMAWTVYNDGSPTYHTNNAGNTAPIGLEIQQTTFAYNREDAMGNIVFMKFKIKNAGTKVLKQVFASIWSDPDLGGASDDLVGCDTLLSLGYCYNATNADQKYGSRPPSVGFDFFQGPLEFTGNLADTAKMWGIKYPEYKNQPMSSFNKYINGTDPSSKTNTYNYMQGLNRDGSPYTFGGQTLKFFNSGDPIGGTGDLDANPADRRMMLTTGPFSLRPGDSTEVLVAVICGQGSDRLTSISAMKYYDRFAQSAYDLDFNLPSPPKPPAVKVVTYDGEINLTWTDTSEKDHGDYPFEGYTVLQGPTAAGPWTRVPTANYDIRNGVAVIFDDVFDINSGVVINEPVKFGSDPGVRRWISLTKDYLTGTELFNASDYFYRVEAYSYDPLATPKTLTSATVLKAVPQKPVAEKKFTFVPDSIIPVTHIGISDGSVVPQVINPDSLTGHTYKVFFTLDSVGAVYWTLRDVTAGVDKFTKQYNQGSTPDVREDYGMVDGMMVKVYGPPPGYKGGEPGDPDSGWTVPSGSRRFTQAGGADGLGLDDFRGAAGWAGAPGAFFEGVSVGPDRCRNLEFRLATTDSVGNFNPDDSNVSYGYRYLRRASQAPAQPSFTPYILNPTGGYAYQIFERNVPLSVWNIDVNPPQRLAVGFLENNVTDGTVDGRYWPPYNGTYDNTDAAGPREWLFVFDTAYTTTPEPTMEVDILNAAYTPMVVMATWAGRNDPITNASGASFHAGDQFRMFANHINFTADTFTFVATATAMASGNSVLNNIKTVPNPYYLFASYDRSTYNRRIQFTNLPTTCTVSIYTLTGERIVVLHKSDPTTSLLDWNVLTDNNVPVASGIYIWVVDAPGFGTKIGKMAVFTEQEQLGTY